MEKQCNCAHGENCWVSINQAATHWSVSRDTMRRIIAEQQIETRKLGRNVRIRRADMIELGKVETA